MKVSGFFFKLKIDLQDILVSSLLTELKTL